MATAEAATWLPIGDAGQLQKPLHGAVLAVGPMEDGENDIDPLPDHTVPLKGEKPLAPHRGRWLPGDCPGSAPTGRREGGCSPGW